MKRKTTISEREIKGLLSSMKEEVAAPRDFRSKIISRLAAETGQSAPAESRPAWSRFIDFVPSPLALRLATASLLLGFGLYIATRPVQVTPPEAPGSMPVTASKAAPAAAPAVAKISKPIQKAAVQVAKAMEPKAPKADEAILIEAPSIERAMPASSAGGSASEVQPPSFGGGGMSGPAASSSFSAAGMPTAVIEPTSTPMPKPMAGNSQVRRNRFLASRGEYASILFRLKAPGKARIEAYDRNGKLVAVIHEGQHPAGLFEIRWFGHDDSGSIAPTGIYLIRVKTDEFEERHKAVLVR